jgi:hypothetical protein
MQEQTDLEFLQSNRWKKLTALELLPKQADTVAHLPIRILLLSLVLG